MWYNSGVVGNAWNLTFRKLKLYLPHLRHNLSISITLSVYVLILSSHSRKDLGVMLNSKLYFQCHVDFVHCQAFTTLGLERNVTYNFSSLDSTLVL